jgi:hypothetical protein
MSKKQTPAQVATTIANYIKKQEDVLAKYKSGPMANAARMNLEKAQKAMAALMQTNEAMRKQKMSEEQYDEIEDMMEGEESDEMRYGGMRKMPGGGKVPVNALLGALSQVQSQQPQGINEALMANALQNAPSQDKLMSFVMARYPQQQLNQMNPAMLRTNPYVLMDYNNALQQINPAPRYNPPMMYGGLLEYMYGGNVGQKKKPAGVSNLRKMAEGGPADAGKYGPIPPQRFTKEGKPTKETIEANAQYLYPILVDKGVKFPGAVIAQWRQETGGKLPTGTQGSFIGIKYTDADYKRFREAGIAVGYRDFNTTEERGGKKQKEEANFFTFSNIPDAVEAYVMFLNNNERYNKALAAKTPGEYIRAIAKAGYATGSTYADSVLNIYDDYGFDSNKPEQGQYNPFISQLQPIPPSQLSDAVLYSSPSVNLATQPYGALSLDRLITAAPDATRVDIDVPLGPFLNPSFQEKYEKYLPDLRNQELLNALGGTQDIEQFTPAPAKINAKLPPSDKYTEKDAPNVVGPAEGGDNITIPNVSWMQAIPALASMASARIGQNALDGLTAPQAPVTTMVPQFEYQSNIGQALQDVRNATTAMGRNTMMSSAQNAAMRQGMLAERFNQEARLRSSDQQTRQQAEAQYQNLATNVRIANDALRNQYVQDSVAFENTRKMQDAQLRTVPLQTLSAGVSDYLKNVYGPGLANALYASNRPYDTQYNFDELLTPKKN